MKLASVVPSDLDQILLSLSTSPAGHPYLAYDLGEEFVDASVASKIESYFREGYASVLIRLGVSDIKTPSVPSITFYQSFGRLFVTTARRAIGQGTEALATTLDIPIPSSEIATLYAKLPFMIGSDYINVGTLCALWIDMVAALKEELIFFKGSFYEYLAQYNPNWNKVGRVCFHLAENKTNTTHPFAFLATYTTHLSESSSVKHVPLGQALKEYAGEQNRPQLLALLVPVQKAAEKSCFVKELLDRSTIFQPQAWTAHQAHAFLKDIPAIEESGIVIRVPNWWTPKQPPRPQVTISIGNKAISAVGLTALLDFEMQYSLSDGETLTYDELQDILDKQENLVQVKGQWVEVDYSKISHVLSHWQTVAKQARQNGLSFAEGLRLIAGVSSQKKESDEFTENVVNWSNVIEGPWLEETLNQLRHPCRSHLIR